MNRYRDYGSGGVRRVDQKSEVLKSTGKPRIHNTHGYQAVWRKSGSTYTKFFSDSKYGGKRKALKVTQDFLKEATKEEGL